MKWSDTHTKEDAISLLEEHGCPLEGMTNREVLYWVVANQETFPVPAVELMVTFFPHHRPQLSQGESDE